MKVSSVSELHKLSGDLLAQDGKVAMFKEKITFLKARNGLEAGAFMNIVFSERQGPVKYTMNANETVMVLQRILDEEIVKLEDLTKQYEALLIKVTN